MRTILIPDTWNKKDIPLKNLTLPKELIISLIRRKTDDKEEIIFPKGDDYILPSDEITIVGEFNEMYNLSTIFNYKETKIKSAVLAGGSSIALSLAKILEKLNIKTKIIEKNEKRCQVLADLLPNTTIINQDATNVEFLHSEEIKKTDIFISCTTQDQVNVLTSLLAKQIGCPNILAVISDINISPILRKLNIHYTLSEKVNLANRILSIIHSEKIISVASLCENQAKVLEIKVSEESKLVGIPLSDLRIHLPKNLIIAAIENKGKVMIGKGDRIISTNDTLIIVCSPEDVNELKDIF
jgi:trk system potassium uptake protein TrkA